MPLSPEYKAAQQELNRRYRALLDSLPLAPAYGTHPEITMAEIEADRPMFEQHQAMLKEMRLREFLLRGK